MSCSCASSARLRRAYALRPQRRSGYLSAADSKTHRRYPTRRLSTTRATRPTSMSCPRRVPMPQTETPGLRMHLNLLCRPASKWMRGSGRSRTAGRMESSRLERRSAVPSGVRSGGAVSSRGGVKQGASVRKPWMERPRQCPSVRARKALPSSVWTSCEGVDDLRAQTRPVRGEFLVASRALPPGSDAHHPRLLRHLALQVSVPVIARSPGSHDKATVCITADAGGPWTHCASDHGPPRWFSGSSASNGRCRPESRVRGSCLQSPHPGTTG